MTQHLRMKVVALSLDPVSNLPLVLLADEAGHTHLPVAVGVGEASAIAAELDGIQLERPMTHQLACDLLKRSGSAIDRVELDQDDCGTVVAKIVVRLGCGTIVLEAARPSDALAFALRSSAAILVSPAVLQRAERADGPRGLAVDDGAPAEAGELLAALDVGAFGKWKM
jgi:bifunctional DNase/RNase